MEDIREVGAAEGERGGQMKRLLHRKNTAAGQFGRAERCFPAGSRRESMGEQHPGEPRSGRTGSSAPGGSRRESSGAFLPAGAWIREKEVHLRPKRSSVLDVMAADDYLAATSAKTIAVSKIYLLAIFCTVCLVLSFLMAGCRRANENQAPEEPVAETNTLQIGVSFDSFVIERWVRDRDVFVSTAESLGAAVNVQNANGKVDEQISQIEYFIRKKMDVIVIIAIDGMALREVVQKARAEGIKVICYDRLIPNTQTDLYISFDNVAVGRLMGEALTKALDGEGEIFAIYGSSSDHNVELVQQGLEEALARTGIRIVYSTYCDNWLAELAAQAVNEGLEENGRVDGIMCGNDDLASQAIRALSEHRLAGKVAVTAQDAELSACQRIVEGTQTMTVFKSVETLARQAAIAAVALGNGQDITEESSPEGTDFQVSEVIETGNYQVPYYRIDPVAVTADNMDEIIIGSGFHRREDVYLNIVEQ